MPTILPQLYPSDIRAPEETRWLSAPEFSGADSDVNLIFRGEINFTSGSPIRLDIAAQGRYVFSLNGFTGQGPVRGTGKHRWFDSYDLSAVLRPGLNRIVVELHYPGAHYRTCQSGAPALWSRLSSGKILNWEYAADPTVIAPGYEYTFQLGRCEYRDMRRSGAEWKKPEETAPPVGVTLLPRPIPPLTTERVEPVKIVKRGWLPAADCDDFAKLLLEEEQSAAPEAFDGSTFALPPEGKGGAFAIYDFGREVLGATVIDLDAPSGTVVDRGYNELFERERITTIYPFGSWKPRAKTPADAYRFADRRILGECGRIETRRFDRGFRFLLVAVRNYDRPVKIRELYAENRIFPMAASASLFECDDEYLNRLDRKCRHTVRQCFEDVYIDCPWREQAYWVNDLEVAVNYYFILNADPSAVRHCLNVAADGFDETGFLPSVYPAGDSMNFPSLPAIWMLILFEYFQHTGDRETLARLLPKAKEILALYDTMTDAGGLVPEQEGWWNFIDIGYANAKADFKGAAAPLNALIAAAFDCFAGLGGGAEAAARSRSILDAMVSRLWDAEHRRFRDSETPEHGFESYSVHPAAILLKYDLLPEKRVDLASVLFDPGAIQAEPYYQYFVLEAAAKSGLPDQAERTLRSLWAEMNDSDSPTLWEIAKFGPRPNLNTANSCCHGFSCAPLGYFHRQLAGIRPLEAGFKTFSFTPLWKDDFRCVQPTPFGGIAAERREGVLTLCVPHGTRARLATGQFLEAGNHII